MHVRRSARGVVMLVRIAFAGVLVLLDRLPVRCGRPFGKPFLELGAVAHPKGNVDLDCAFQVRVGGWQQWPLSW